MNGVRLMRTPTRSNPAPSSPLPPPLEVRDTVGGSAACGEGTAKTSNSGVCGGTAASWGRRTEQATCCASFGKSITP